ncbi:MAG: efflux RND transporter permease subunit [Desulfobacterales bacterium]|nr:efflux RND transporter permease subunit [Desulfobacterales bacterium]
MFLSDGALRKPIATSTLILGFIIIGFFTLNRIGIDFLPAIDFPYVTVVTIYPGAGPQEIETLISKKIEDAVSEVDSIKEIRSVSMENISQVFIEFELGTNVDFSAIDVREKIDQIKRDLPSDIDPPVILKVDVNAKPIMNLAAYGDRPIGEIYDVADLKLRDRLSQIPGMASVDLIGGKKREIQVLVDLQRLAAYGVSILKVMQSIGKENLSLPSGHIVESRTEHTIRFEGEFNNISDLGMVEIPAKNGKTVKLTDIATIKDDFEEQRIISRYNGKECVTLRLKKKSDANTVAVVDKIKESLDELRIMLPKGVNLEVVSDDSAFVRYSVEDVKENMIIGIILTVIILFLFLHNFWATIVAGIAIPISIIATLIPIYFAGFTLNMMSLMALAISVGVLVMNALVVLENIYRHLDEGETPYKAAKLGTGEIALAVFASASTNIVVFLPIAFMQGMVGQFFYQFGVSVVFATIVSLLVSFTVTPILSSIFCKKVDTKRSAINPLKYLFWVWDKLYGGLESFYGYLLGKSLRWRWVVIVIALLCFFGAKQFSKHIGSEMITEADRAEATITVEMPPGTNIFETSKTVEDIEKLLSSMPEFKGSLSTVGKIEGVIGKNTEGVHVAQILLLLTDKNKRGKNIKTVLTEIRGKLKNVPNATILVFQPSGIGGVDAPIQVELTGENFDKLQEFSEKILSISTNIDGTVDVNTSWKSGKPEVRIFPDRKKLSDHGINIEMFAVIMRTYLEGTVADQYRELDEEYDIRVKLRELDRKTTDSLKEMLIPLPSGGVVPISHFSTIKEAEGPTQILRKNKERLIIISMSAKGKSIGEIAQEIDTKIDEMGLLPGYRTVQGGSVKRMKESFADISTAFLLAIILTYLVLSALLESYIQPFSIMLTIPLSLIGVWIALYLAKETFNIFSMMAVVMLVGIVVNNAILIIDYAVVLIGNGKSRNDAMLEASTTRLRPILMTTLAAAFAMVPLALAWGWGAEMRASMAVASIGGLFSSAVLTLFVVPVMYTYLDDLSGFFKKIFSMLKSSR